MNSRLRVNNARRLPAVAGALVAGVLLSGCAAGFDATSIKPYAPADGVNGESGDVRALNVLVVAAPSASSGVVVMTIANDGTRDDRLTGIETPSGTVTLSGPGELPAGGTTQFSNDTENTAVVSNLTKLAGEAITLRLRFERAEPLRIRTVVMPATGAYEGITPSPTASPTG